MSHTYPEGYERIVPLLAQLADEGDLLVPSYPSTIRWIKQGKIRALRYGGGQILVSIEDMRARCTPIPVQ
jgi:hypothetical protein